MPIQLTSDEVRDLVVMYYDVQKARIAINNQAKAYGRDERPHDALDYFTERLHKVESEAVPLLRRFAESTDIGRWSLAVCGIGPVLAAGLIAHIDPAHTPHVGALWSYAGLTPGQKRRKGVRINWNPELKLICWKLGESFVRVQANEKDIYGAVYRRRKDYEIRKNENGDYADQAAASLAERTWKKDNVTRRAYAAGKLPDARIHERAKRYAVKLFLSHWLELAHQYRFGTPPPRPYAFAHLLHADYIAPPVLVEGQPIAVWPEQALPSGGLVKA